MEIRPLIYLITDTYCSWWFHPAHYLINTQITFLLIGSPDADPHHQPTHRLGVAPMVTCYERQLNSLSSKLSERPVCGVPGYKDASKERVEPCLVPKSQSASHPSFTHISHALQSIVCHLNFPFSYDRPLQRGPSFPHPTSPSLRCLLFTLSNQDPIVDAKCMLQTSLRRTHSNVQVH